MNFINNIKVIESGKYKDIPVCLISINEKAKIQYMILLNCNEEQGDGYIYDDIDVAKRDFQSLLNNDFDNVFSKED